MAFNSIKIIGNGVAQTAITNTHIVESVVHSLLAYNTSGSTTSFSIAVDGSTVVTQSIAAGGSYTLPIKLNVPVGASMTVTAATGVDVTVNYYSQAIDTVAATTVLQDTVTDGVASVTSTKDTSVTTLNGIVTAGTTTLNDIVSTGTATVAGLVADAEAHVAGIPDGTINDGITTTVDTWSSSKISSELANTGGGDFVAITENSKTGYGTSHRAANPANYGDIGTQAVDFSHSDSASTSRGATGDYSTAMGRYCSASGFNSTAMGNSCMASGINSTAMGNSCMASGQASTAIGFYADTHNIRSKLAIGAAFTSAGKTQTGVITLGDVTTDGTTKILTANQQGAAATNNHLILPNNAAQAFRGLVVADATGMAASWEITGLVRRGSNASYTVLVGSAVTKMYGDAGLDACTVELVVNTSTGGVMVNVKGLASTTINWTCSIWTAEAI